MFTLWTIDKPSNPYLNNMPLPHERVTVPYRSLGYSLFRYCVFLRGRANSWFDNGVEALAYAKEIGGKAEICDPIAAKS